MKILLHRNYSKISIDEHSIDTHVSVLFARNKAEHLPFEGFMDFQSVNQRLIERSNCGYLGAFFGSVGWRESEHESWHFTGEGEYGVGYIETGVYAVLDCNKPLIWTADRFSDSVYPAYNPMTVITPTDNVVSLSKKKLNNF